MTSGDGDDEARTLLDPRLSPVLEFGDDVEERTAGTELSTEYLRRFNFASHHKMRNEMGKRSLINNEILARLFLTLPLRELRHHPTRSWTWLRRSSWPSRMT